VLLPCVAPKLVPLIVTEVPTGPEVGFKLVSAGVTAKATALLAKLAAVTITLPVVAPAGTGTTMLVGLQLVGVAVAPPNVTALVPWDVPKLFPVMVTEVPTGPAVGLMLVIVGVIVKTGPPLLDTPETTMETPTRLYADRLPGTIATTLVSLQLVTAVATEPIITELVPWVSPKPVPVMVTELPAGPEVGLRPEMSGTGPVLMVKATPLLATPPTVTTTLPEVAPLGTSIEIEVVLQLLGAARVPLKVTVLVP